MTSSKRVALIVEDNPSLSRAMGAELGKMGFDVRSASTYDAAVAHLTKQKPDLVCVDLGLPVQSGYELCEHIRGPLALTVPILVTADSGFAFDMANAETAGASAFLKKPFTMRQLTGHVEALFDDPQKTRPSARRLAR